MKTNPHISKQWRKMLCCSYLAGMLLLLAPGHNQAQEIYQLEDMFMNAETWFYFQDYKNSLPLFLKVHDAYPENDNINYKIGFCYLNIDGQENKAIPYLKRAAANTTFNFTRESFYEREAPVDAIFYLGNAYLVNNQLDKAIATYERFENKIKNRRSIFFDESDYDFEYLQKQIEACNIAKDMMSDPVNYTAENLGIPVNTPQSEFNPVISGDGKTLIFTAEKKFYTGIFMSEKENGTWTAPINLLPQLGIDGDCETTSLSYDGTELYLYREDELDGNLYVSYFKNGRWSNIQKLGENINTRFWESHAYIAPEGNKLYFTSNREGGYGDLDIYVSERQNDGTWGPATNLGSTINTQWREDTPFLTKEGDKLFFSSEGHHNMGGFDLFVSQKTDNNWTSPKNLGYPINTTDDDKFLTPIKSGNQAYYAKFNRNTAGKKDIFKYNLDNLETTDFIRVEGVLTYKSPERKEQEKFQINVIDTQSQDTIAKLQPANRNDIAFKTPSGENHLIYETPLLKNNKQYIISQDYEIKTTYLKPKKLAEQPKKEKPEINLDKEVFQAQSSEENIKIKMQLKGGNKLVVSTFSQGKLINTEEFPVNKEQFIYEYTPKVKNSKLTFSLLDDQEQIFTKDVNILVDSLAGERAEKDQEPRLEITEKGYTLSPENKNIKIKLSVEKGSRLFVETFVDNKLINKEEFDINQEQFTYEFEPKKEKSKLNFKLIDKNQNVSNREIVISHKPITNQLKSLLGAVNQFNTSAISAYLNALAIMNLNAPDLIDSLFQGAANQKIQPKDVETLIYTSILLSEDSDEKLLQYLQQKAEGPLKIWLNDITNKDFTSKEELIELMLQATGNHDFTRTDVNKLLGKYLASNYNSREIQNKFNEIAQLNFHYILNRLEQDAIDLTTPEELIAYFKEKQYLEAKRITAFLKSLNLINKAIAQPEKIEKPQIEQGQKPSKIIPYILAGVVISLLVIFILTLIKRRRSNNSKS